jgi:hypothetical protein
MGSLKYPCSRLGSAPNLPFGAAASSVLDLHSFRADSNSKFRRPACRTDAVYTAGRRAVQFDRGKLRVRYLFIENGCNSVRSPYASTSSLSSGNQFENMRSAIAFMVFRAWMRVVLFCVRGFEIQRNSKGRIFILCHKSGISLRSSLFRSCPDTDAFASFDAEWMMMLRLTFPATLIAAIATCSAACAADTPPNEGWSLHGQTTFIAQGYPPMRSRYQGENSLPGTGELRETWTATLFLGRRLWEGAEIYFNPELAQGFGLAHTLGLGGFSNGEAQKAGGTLPKYRSQRYFLRQTFGLGGEQETVEDGPNQIAGKRDINRITLTVGRFAVGDFFDANSYAHDPRADFLNWAIWSSGAYDFPADLPGFTRGAVAELNRKDWALRAGFFQVPNEPNSDVLVFNSGGGVVEFEERHRLWGEPGKIRIGVFGNRGHAGNYREAIAAVSANPALDINDVMAGIRRNNPKYGMYINAEQAISRDAGVFARASWNDGKNEILSFTDIDRSVSAGFSLKGRQWGRPADAFGVGAAVNGLSEPHRQFLGAGGLGLLIGDGAINYRPETIAEVFYAVSLNSWSTLTFDYQFVANPAYNADRGPVSIFAARLHAEF